VTLSTRPAIEWERGLTQLGVPAARILTVPQAVDQEQLAYRGFFSDLPFPDGSDRTVRVVGNGVLIDGEASHPPTPPPLLGQHNIEILSGHPGDQEVPPADDYKELTAS